MGTTFREFRRHLIVGALLAGVVGCGTGAAAGSTPAPASVTSASSTTKTTAKPSTGATNGVPVATSASDAVVYWVTQVLEAHYQRACLASAPAVAGSGQGSSQVCPSKVFTKVAQNLHNAWAKPGITLPPESKVGVDATTLPSANGTVDVPDTMITVDGRTLRSIELIGATGDTGSISLSLVVSNVGNAWYVSDWNINL